MDVSEAKGDAGSLNKSENNMMATGMHCLNDGEEMEVVTGEIRYTCHFCGSVWEIARDETGKPKTVEVLFGGH